MNGEDRMSSWTIFIQFVFSYGFIVLSFEQNLLSIFFIISLSSCQSFHQNISFVIFLDIECISVVLVEQIDQLLVIEFKIGNWYFDLMLIPWVNFFVKRGKKSRDNTSILIVIGCSSHWKGFACSCLSIAENTSWVSFKSRGEYFFWGKIIDNLLRGIIQNFFELEAPLILLMIDNSSFDGSFYMYVDVAELRSRYPDCSSTLICWCAKLEVGLNLMRTLIGAFFIM